MKRRLVFLALTVALLIALSTTLTVRANTAQTWYLWDNDYLETVADDGLNHGVDSLMSVTGIGGVTAIFVELIYDPDPGLSQVAAWWYTEEAAQTDVSFGESAWTAHMYVLNQDLQEDILYAEIYSVQADGTITRRLTYGSWPLSEYEEWLTFSLPDDAATPQTIPAGDRLAVKLWWDDVDGYPLLVYYNGSAQDDGDAYIESPATDPGYPVPELPSLILVGGGLAALATYLILGRRKKSYAGT